MLDELLDLNQTVYCVWNRFDLGAHVQRMGKRHPDWSDRKLRCVLYWQGTARKQLREKVEAVLAEIQGMIALYCPEASGVDVTATMASIGVELEWPPNQWAYQVALVGVPLAQR